MAAIDPHFWSERSVLVTGHSGFKGAWLSLWLQSLGARVCGLSRSAPTEPSLYELARVGERMTAEADVDIRDAGAVTAAVRAAAPEVVFHLAAQPMVRLSLREPRLTYEVNVLGTANLLEAVRRTGDSVRAVVVVTSDKCYANPPGTRRRFVEDDALGGRDPYSSSKACAELLTAAWRASYFSADAGATRVATARAGNVIGGGDFGEDRLVPDVLRAHRAGRRVLVRSPDAVRPWQHVLNPLAGYLLLAQALCRPDLAAVDRPWNFGPRADDSRPVRELLGRLDELLEGGLGWELDEAPHAPEAGHLEIDSSAAEQELGWLPRWDLQEALARVVRWHAAEREGRDMRLVGLEQLAEFAAG